MATDDVLTPSSVRSVAMEIFPDWLADAVDCWLEVFGDEEGVAECFLVCLRGGESMVCSEGLWRGSFSKNTLRVSF